MTISGVNRVNTLLVSSNSGNATLKQSFLEPSSSKKLVSILHEIIVADGERTTMASSSRITESERNLIMIGAGVIGRCLLDILPSEFKFASVTVLDMEKPEEGVLPSWTVYHQEEFTEENYESILPKYLKKGDVCLNVSVLESMDLMLWCQENDVLYLDTSGEEWDEQNEDFITHDLRCMQQDLTLNGIQKRMRAFLSELKKEYPTKLEWPTAVLYHGMNPGIVNHCMKRGLMDLAANILKLPDVANRGAIEDAMNKGNFAALSHELGVKTIHVAERDSQVSSRPRYSGQFASTWSVDGFVQELQMYSELVLGTHEKCIPANAVHWKESPHSVALGTKGANTRIFSWVPSGPTLGYLTPHDEVLTMGEYLSIHDDDGNLQYRPTILFSYMPCDLSVASIHELILNGYEDPEEVFLDGNDIISGKDEVGILLLGHRLGAWWTGSTMSIEDARKVLPDCGHSPTSIQVASGVIGSLHWLLRHPKEGVCTPEMLDHNEVLEKAMPYLEPFVSVQSSFDPLEHPLFHFYDYENTFGSIKDGSNWKPDSSWRWQLPVFLQGPTDLIPSPYYVVDTRGSNQNATLDKKTADHTSTTESDETTGAMVLHGHADDKNVLIGDCNLGKGLFATKDMSRGEKIIEFRGPKISGKQVDVEKDETTQANPLQVGPNEYLDLDQPCVYGNHSCDPNAGLVSHNTRTDESIITLVACRNIAKGDEIFFDYSTSMAEDEWTMDCRCGSSCCRKVVLDFSCLPIPDMEKLLRDGVVLPHVVDALRGEEPPFDVDVLIKEGRIAQQSGNKDSENVFVREQIGIFASSDFSPGDSILELKIIKTYNGEECDAMSNADYLHEIGLDTWAQFSKPFSDCNHSCDPNAGIVQDKLLVARRAIQKGEEITWDVATSRSGQDDDWPSPCNCSTAKCRRVKNDFFGLPNSTQIEYIKEGIIFKHVAVEAEAD